MPAHEAGAPSAAGSDSSNVATTASASLAPLAKTACTILHEKPGSISGVTLRHEGVAFATIDYFTRVEMRLDGEAGTATFDVAGLHVTGEVKVKDLELYLRRSELRDGWLDVKRIRPVRADAGALAAQVLLPAGFAATSAVAEVRASCGDVDVSPPWRAIDASAKVVGFKDGATASVQSAPDGPAVGTMSTPAVDPNVVQVPKTEPSLVVHQLETRGARAKVRIEGTDSIVVGWVDRTAIGAPRTEPTAHPSRPGYSSVMRSHRCPAPVPVFVRAGQREVEVGSFEANAQIALLELNADGSVPVGREQVGVDLGLEPAHAGYRFQGPKLVAFVRGAALAGCAQR